MSTSILVYKNISKFLIVCTVEDLQWKFTRWPLHINLYDKYRTIFLIITKRLKADYTN